MGGSRAGHYDNIGKKSSFFNVNSEQKSKRIKFPSAARPILKILDLTHSM